MNITDDIKSITYLKSHTADLFEQINYTHRPIIITQNGEAKAVLQDPKSYENMKNAVGILQLITQGEKDIKNNKTKSQKQVFDNIEKKLNQKEKLK